MKRFLNMIAPRTLNKIADDLLGVDAARASKNKAVDVAEYCKAYRLNTLDLTARYPELKHDKGRRT